MHIEVYLSAFVQSPQYFSSIIRQNKKFVTAAQPKTLVWILVILITQNVKQILYTLQSNQKQTTDIYIIDGYRDS